MLPAILNSLSIHSWHDALIWIVSIVVFYICRSIFTLAKRVTHVSLPNREFSFREGFWRSIRQGPHRKKTNKKLVRRNK